VRPGIIKLRIGPELFWELEKENSPHSAFFRFTRGFFRVSRSAVAPVGRGAPGMTGCNLGHYFLPDKNFYGKMRSNLVQAAAEQAEAEDGGS